MRQEIGAEPSRTEEKQSIDKVTDILGRDGESHGKYGKMSN